MGFISQLGASIFNSAFVPLAAELDITIQQASYTTTSSTLFTGITAVLMAPYSNIYGRRPLYLVSLHCSYPGLTCM